MGVFFSGFRGSRDLFARATIHFPRTQKKGIIPYIYNAFNKDSF